MPGVRSTLNAGRLAAAVKLSLLCAVILFASSTHAASVANEPDVSSSSSNKYKQDRSWPQAGGLPHGASRFTAAAVHPTTQHLFLSQRSLNYSAPLIELTPNGTFIRAFGNDLVSNSTDYGVHGIQFQQNDKHAQDPFLWIADLEEHTVKRTDAQAEVSITYGVKGKAGTSLSPLMFGSVADVAFDEKTGRVFVTDGDGGINDRVICLAANGTLVWTTGNPTSPQLFSSPHSLMFHPPSNTVLVADRGHNRTVQLDAETGHVIDEWNCMRPGTPWGLRFVPSSNLIAQADGNSQTLSLFDASAISSTGLGACRILQTLQVDRSHCNTPHLLAVNDHDDTIYMTCVDEPNSSVVRFVPDK